ncbi:hypothetical protein [Streptomyces hydrogenans]|uniref:hypothetical protein n=1 Tax=Streptomyces hydrogenans TaxID=1873719 RepID=UPI0035DB9C9E
MKKSILVESIRYSAACPGCGAEAEWSGVQALVGEELGIGLGEVRAVLEQISTGQYAGTLPEMELLARKLRASGIEAAASRTAD